MNSSSDVKTFREVLGADAELYRVTLSTEALEGLSQYYELLNAWNSRLHLVGPTSAKEFASRHILESLLLLGYLSKGAKVADIGSGAGLPIIPCLIVRPDIQAVLIEASKRKAVFLREVLNLTTMSNRATVFAERFERIPAPDVDFVTCRALERFEKLLPQILEWTPHKARLLLFGGEGLGMKIEKSGLASTAHLLPNSQRRFLFVARKA